MGGARPDEDDLIARWFGPLATAPGALGLKDDAATFPVPAGFELVVTTDALVAGVHFFADDPPDAVARKALRVNISDLVGKGSTPAGYLLTLALPPDWTEDWVEAFAAGLAADQREFGISLFGGDTVQTPGPLWLSVAGLGLAPAGRVPRRTGAAPGERIFVTGTIGDAALGLLLRLDPARAGRWGLTVAQADHLRDRYLLPRPKVAAAQIVGAFASAAMDVSDGLAIDSARLCKASCVSAAIEVGAVPLSPAARRAVEADPSLWETVLTGGDDYEVLLTVPEGRGSAFRDAAAGAGVPVASIGTIGEAAEPPLTMRGPAGPMRLARLGFRHF